MSWLQVAVQLAVLIVVLAVLFEITFRRIKALLVIRGMVEDGLAAVVGRVDVHKTRLDGHEKRLEVVERELKLR
jgi:dolichol kinase